jgi:hypothetical protein
MKLKKFLSFITKEVSEVSFVSNLVNSTNIILNTDELIQPFTKEN